VPAVDRNWIAALPKAEVHLHLEGCVPAALVGQHVPLVSSLPALLSQLDVLCGAVTHRRQLAEIARQLCARAKDSGARHIDVIVNPTHWPPWQRRLGEMFDALDDQFQASESAGGPTVGLCVSLSRSQSRQEADELVDTVLALGHRRVVALSIDGNEASGSHNQRFAAAFARAREAGLHRCAHAGESSGASGVREAIELLDAERIDHGIRCLEDPSLVIELAERGIPLDVCPTSNVVLGLVKDFQSHPIEALRSAGVPVSVNTDDPLLYGIDLVSEYERCAAAFGWGAAELGQVARTSIESCFATRARRSDLLAELDRFLEASAT
jgi:adenosine deaminase